VLTGLVPRPPRSLLGYEDLIAVQAGPEGADGGRPDMFEGQEEARGHL